MPKIVYGDQLILQDSVTAAKTLAELAAAGGGDMEAATYDPASKAEQVLTIGDLENPPIEDEAGKTATSEYIFDHNAKKSANAVLGHVVVETTSKIDVDGDGKLTLGSDVLLEADLEGSPTEDLATKAPTSEWAFDHNADEEAHHTQRVVEVALNGSTALTTDDKGMFRIPAVMNGWNLVTVAACCAAPGSTSGAITITVQNGATNMLSTNITIDQDEMDTIGAAVAAVIDEAQDDVATSNQIWVEVTGAGADVAYCVVELTFQLP